ncbi:sulfate adenylyltransferase [Candidatus Woesearchaeota archaeon]|nr:sulfate adenylyltransferase [Candidatus Woesearchaeota archaeon]
MKQKTEVVVTIGPATWTEGDLRKIKDKGVDFVRVNMSHSTLADLKRCLALAQKVGIPFIIDTEGSQVRTGELTTPCLTVEENDEIRIHTTEIIGDKENFNLKPISVVSQLEVGDLISIDFDTVTLRISDNSALAQGYIMARVVTGGSLGKNKAVVIDPVSQKKLVLPTLSEKDFQSIAIGLEEGVGYIAASFMRSGKAVEEVRAATQNTMKIISKIECVNALENLDDIIKRSDFLLIDRGDLSKEIPIEKIPFTQKLIISRAKKQGVGVFIATNLLETMVEHRKPTRAEVHDVIATIADGAQGLTLSAETAIGKYPLECITMLNKLIRHAQLAIDGEKRSDAKEEDSFVQKLESRNYLLDFDISSSLIPPHGGKLVNGLAKPNEWSSASVLNALPKIVLDEERIMDIEQMAIGTFSPLDGFMKENDLHSVLDRMRLADGTIWPLPIVLDVSEEKSKNLECGKDVALTDEQGNTLAILRLEQKYPVNLSEMAQKMYGTLDREHPGVKKVLSYSPHFFGGIITLLRRKLRDHKEYELTPRQARALFEDRGWEKVVGFHTRNVIHRSHEFIQLKALEQSLGDGLFVHPIVGKKKAGDFQAKFIIQSYEHMSRHVYPKNKVLLGTFATYSRYAGPREALFTALCRKNFGCSHFIVGRDHTGVGKFYHPKASHTIFDRFPDLGIIPIRFDNVFYSEKLQTHIHEREHPAHPADDRLLISGTQARKMFESGDVPPSWFMRPEISQMIVDAVKKGEEVFVR